VFRQLINLTHGARSHPWLCLGLVLGLAALLAWVGVGCWRSHQYRAAEEALCEGRLEEARDRLERCRAYWPHDPDVLSAAARLERVEGQFDQAEALLGQCMAYAPHHRRAGLEAALLRVQRGDLADEPVLLALVDAQDPESPWILEALARAHLAGLRYRPTLVRVVKWLRLQPDCVRALELRARLFLSSQNAVEAQKLYERVLELQPGRWQTRRRFATVLLDGYNLQEAIPHLELLEQEHAADADVALLLARREMLQGHADTARAWAERAVAANPLHVKAMLLLGRVDLQLDRAHDAEKWLLRAAKVRPYDMEVNQALFTCYGRQPGAKAKADFYCKKHELIEKYTYELDDLLLRKIAEQPTDPKLLTEVGRRFLAIGEERLGIDWLTRALKYDPKYDRAHAALADYYEQAGQSAKAAVHRAQAGSGPGPT